MPNTAAADGAECMGEPGPMRLHSTLQGRVRGYRLRGAAWALEDHAFRGFVYLIPLQRGGDPRYRIVEARGPDLWTLLAGIERQVASLCGSAVARLDATLVDAGRGVGAAAGSADPMEASSNDR